MYVSKSYSLPEMITFSCHLLFSQSYATRHHVTLDINAEVTDKKTRGFSKMQIRNRYRIGLVNKSLLYWITALLEKYAVSIFSFQGSANAELWPTHNLSPAFKTCKYAGSDVIREKCLFCVFSSGYKSSMKTRKRLL